MRSENKVINFSDKKDTQTILIIEDEKDDFEIAERQIKKLWPKAKVIHVLSLRDAQRALSQEDCDMVLLDLNLPDGLGPTSVETIRKSDKKIPIIVITGLATNFTVDESLKLGANNVVPKEEITTEDFMNILEQNKNT